MKNRIVFSPDQIDLLINDPLLTVATFVALKNDPSMTVSEAIRFGHASLRQHDMFNQAVASGEIVKPTTVEELESNRVKMAQIFSDAQKSVDDEEKEKLTVEDAVSKDKK